MMIKQEYCDGRRQRKENRISKTRIWLDVKGERDTENDKGGLSSIDYFLQFWSYFQNLGT